MKKIPDEIMREADRIYGQLGRGVASDVTAIVRALLARDQRAAEIARKHRPSWLSPNTAHLRQKADSIARAILTYDEAHHD
ncbi:MAG TPA: hypothetical protein VF226_02810 [Hyphomicrobiaceae bacterium]